MSEQELLNEVRRLAAGLQWLTYHTHRSFKSEPGFPDLVLSRDTLIIAELKSEAGKLHGDQALWIERLIHAGVECYLWRPSDLPFITQRLGRRGRFEVEVPTEVTDYLARVA